MAVPFSSTTSTTETPVAGASLLDEVVINERSDRVWQKRMLPLIIQTIIGLMVFFFAVSLVQLTYLQVTSRKAPTLQVDRAFTAIEQSPAPSYEAQRKTAYLKALALLDAGTTERRYYQINMGLMARIWTQYMGFVTGMILSLVGAFFILGKLQEPSAIATDSTEARLTITRASPGIILATLGVALMIATIAINHRIEFTDAPGYLRYFDAGAAATSSGLPDLPPNLDSALKQIRPKR